MAQPLRRPLSTAIGLSSSSSRPRPSLPRRSFSQTTPRCRSVVQTSGQRPQQAPERSMRVMQKEAAAKMVKLPSDLGLLPMTFIRPLKYPSFTKYGLQPLFRMWWKSWFYRGRDLLQLLAMKLQSPKEPGSRWYFFNKVIKLRSRQIVPTAKVLHSEMYSAFAAGDTDALRKICCDGMYDSFRARIGVRRKGAKMRWELLRYEGKPKRVSQRAGTVPMEGGFVRQAVVRIVSVQRLTRFDEKGRVVSGTGEERRCVEYLVLQMLYSGWSEQTAGWKVWGTTEETTLGDLEEWDMAGLEK